MKAIISRTSNGAWVRIVDKDAMEVRTEDLSYQFDAYKHDGEDMSGLVHMLYEVVDQMGWVGDRRDKERIQIRVVHGDKFEHGPDDPPSECRICFDNKPI